MVETATQTTRDQVAAYLEQGLTVRQIAQLLGISTQAVYKHLKRIEQDRQS